jgi:Protein of unknown function (DUF998)
MVSTRRLALAGSTGPALFVVIAAVMTVLEWDFLHQLGWHLVQDSSVPYPSATAMGPYGLLQTLNFIQLGLSVIAIAIGLWRTVAGARVGAGFVFVAGVAIVFAMFTTDGTTNQPTTWHGWIHSLSFLVHVFASMLGAVALAIQLRNNPEWRPIARASIAVPLVIIAILLLAGAVKQAGGLLGIISFSVLNGWYELLGLRLLSLSSKQGSKPLPAGSV